ncbi:alanine dehydrogenase [Oceanotoga teriensis]|uniref:Alanine dehydrogenase n=1 Tax=Oceanotoga teriensis TaxID=515440 RepID=A0AA45C580_9BACT|nr:N(5)-(carboxyethyl)ornithine synthase [Oceanotoga teriensis]PWJ88083.1 alanine dehydrogenase [Oceanotoga teriensis]
MNLGFIIPNYPNERRVALLPEHIENFKENIFIERGFGNNLDISDVEYEKKGCKILSRKEIFDNCEAIFNLKLMQPQDYDFIREGQMIIGWTHPTGSGRGFMENQANVKKLVIVDLDNIYPTIYYDNNKYSIDFIPKNFIRRNSVIAGYASVFQALMAYGKMPDVNTKVAVLSPGNVSQGAYSFISKLGADVRLFYRKTMNEFISEINDYDIIINGIEVDNSDKHIINKKDLERVKKGALIIDAAADAGNAIEGSRYTSIDNPLYKEDRIYFYIVNNAPSLFYRNSSFEISRSFSKHVYSRNLEDFYNVLKRGR